MNTRRPFSKRKIIILSTVILFIGLGISMVYQALDPFRHLRITIHNQSDYDLSNITARVSSGVDSFNTNNEGTIYNLNKAVPSGEQVKFAPQLQLSGEGSVYLEFTNSRGETYNKTVCGYTEYLSGNSYVTVTNETITVREDCM
ncbi:MULTISPECIES: hypothetical protein [unclassified Paenibacillus]|uniref:hypothetical protein n=1 Tax=unclassified Paenibacillus TaxID=185978 RepID=UPI0009A7C675|nr:MULTISPECIES: hypothetical protein [unclassified Paenibacillus]SLK06771.1 hypothetical protein SAMN06272722_104315 [Paenibacillus sp. RU5A]SOC70642.1 hypothetical protein SAMN05880581_104315 [Paenibacillus sp. RU26A]SOC72773.1 hypothetical protein SAMN05880586_104315 [Paenibacillus sp. RU5M]